MTKQYNTFAKEDVKKIEWYNDLIFLTTITLIVFLVYYLYPLFFIGQNEYWEKRMIERENELNDFCKDKFGNNTIVSYQNPNVFNCCKRYKNTNVCLTLIENDFKAKLSFRDKIRLIVDGVLYA